MDIKNLRFTLLLVEDETLLLDMLQTVFSSEGYDILSATSGEEALQQVTGRTVNAALIDLELPGMNGLQLLAELKARFPSIIASILTGRGSIRHAVNAMKIGADDFIEKPPPIDALRALVAKYHETWRFASSLDSDREAPGARFSFPALLGESPPTRLIKSLIARLGPTDASVLVLGETGTGKELVARALHKHSRRSERTFLPVDCATISENLFESELFGHVKGAFTGAQAASKGLIREADGGTVFLDEVGDMIPTVQARLLRTLQEHEVRPVGSPHSIPVDVRIIAASNRDLQAEVDKGAFREDLFYRLKVLSIRIPPLRERREDIALLARCFIKRFRCAETTVEDLSPGALSLLERYEWPGNVRELENAIRSAVILGRSRQIMPGDLPEIIAGAAGSTHGSSGNVSPPAPQSAPAEDPATERLESWELTAIRNALRKTDGNRREAAKLLQISEATLYRKIKEYHIK